MNLHRRTPIRHVLDQGQAIALPWRVVSNSGKTARQIEDSAGNIVAHLQGDVTQRVARGAAIVGAMNKGAP